MDDTKESSIISPMKIVTRNEIRIAHDILKVLPLDNMPASYTELYKKLTEMRERNRDFEVIELFDGPNNPMPPML